VDCLPGGLADGCLYLSCLFCREFLVDVDQELLVDFVCKRVIACEDFDETVVHKCWVGLDHHFLNHCCTGHCVVENFKVVVDGFRGNFLTQPLLKGLVSQVKTDNTGSPDVIPHLLHCSVVYVVEVIRFTNNVSAGDDIRSNCTLADRST
jgi:hypothetical protein